jgi:hypothetical protein
MGRVGDPARDQHARRSSNTRPTKLDLFRSCSDVEAAVDLEADIPPGLDDDAVES